jgi:hypothetical protein
MKNKKKGKEKGMLAEGYLQVFEKKQTFDKDHKKADHF